MRMNKIMPSAFAPRQGLRGIRNERKNRALEHVKEGHACMQHLERTIKMNAQAFISHVHAFASLFSTSQTHLSSKTTKTSPCLSPVGISGQRDTSRGRRNALKKETYRNSLRGIGLITREPVGFLLDLVRFHQRSHHFYLSLFSLSLSKCGVRFLFSGRVFFLARIEDV